MLNNVCFLSQCSLNASLKKHKHTRHLTLLKHMCVCVCVLVRTFKSYFLGKLSIQFIIKNCNHRFIHKTHRTNSSFKRKFVLFDLYFSISSTTCPPPAAKETMTCHFSFHLNTCRILIHISKYSRFLSASDTSAQFQCQTL